MSGAAGGGVITSAMLAPEEGLVMVTRQGEAPLPEFQRDELARYFASLG